MSSYSDYIEEFDEYGYRTRFSRWPSDHPAGKSRFEQNIPPPKPAAPTGTQLLQSYATTHQARAVWNGVKFKTRDHLMLGLDYLAGRITDKSFNHTVKALAESDKDGLGTAMFLMNQPNPNSWYDKNIRKPIEAVVVTDEFLANDGTMFRGDWDYDGPGVWHKASLAVKADKNGFYLRFNAAYVGNKAEQTLVKALGDIATLNIIHYKHRLTYETHGDRWAIPLNDLRIIYASCCREFDADAFLIELLNPVNPECKTGKWADITGPVIVNSDDDNIRCLVKLGYRTLNTRDHDRGEDNKPLDHHGYRIEGEYFTGPAEKRSDSFTEDWRNAIDLEVYLSPVTPYNLNQIEIASKTSDTLTKQLQDLMPRPDPYPND